MKNTRVNVAIRVRPLIDSEINRGETSTQMMNVDMPSNNITISGRIEKWYSFDQVLDSNVKQNEVYDSLNIDNYVKQVVEGYHATIFAYGQTGSGKTFTMEGYDYSSAQSSNSGPQANIQDGDHIGIAPRIIKNMFSKIDSYADTTKNSYRVYCSFLQLYQEKILDLLNPSHTK